MISSSEYLTWDAVAMGQLVRSGQVSPAELEAACRARIAEVDPHIRAIADLAEPVAEVPAPEDAVFQGVPFLVKELLSVPGLPWTMGSRLLAAYPGGPASHYVDRLLASGVRIVASTTSSEFGLLGSTESLLRGTTVNPWGGGLSAGGSSGGSAAAVAAGIVPMAHANDAGGSIRGPAALAGIFGFMPSVDRCAPTSTETGGLMSLLRDHVVSRTVRDSAAMLAATERTGSDARWEPVGRVRGPISRPLRVAVLRHTLLGASPERPVAGALDRTVARLEALGHEIVDIDPPAIDGPALSHAFFATAARTVAGVAEMVGPLLGRAPGPDELEPFTLELADWAKSLPAHDEEASAATIASAGRSYAAMFEGCEVVLSPTFTRPPWPLGTLAPHLGREELISRTEQIVGYTPIHNVTGCPAMSVPLEWHDALPVGMHFAAAPGADALLMSLAFQLEEAHPWADRRPPALVAGAR